MSTPTANNSPDKYLVDRVLSGDKQAFSTIIHNTEGLVAQMVFKMIPRAEDRKDVVQDIYIKVYKNLSGFKYQAKLSTWIGQITYNTCISYLRKKRLVLSGAEDELNHDDDFITARGPVASDESDARIFTKERMTILQSAMEKLSPIHRTLITLYHQEEISYQEIGVITGLPEGTVKSYLFRARKALKENLLLNYKKEEL
ncbi:MAG: sigma-70 family RNA polymerase sigma factor [Chitinophagaceae bacterium]|nr:MAG: sigma-70 family RNA polymerase sigma factor [Chitinophagaceae bacterium]